jgi:hypothetical protein
MMGRAWGHVWPRAIVVFALLATASWIGIIGYAFLKLTVL